MVVGLGGKTLPWAAEDRPTTAVPTTPALTTAQTATTDFFSDETPLPIFPVLAWLALHG